ncbi:MAG: hypothetical protein R3B84_17735, partial [Zavarzinella sp.]
GLTASVTDDELTLSGVPSFDRTVRVSVVADDGTTTAEKEFTFTVNNTAPTIGAVGNQTLNHNVDSLDLTLPITDGDPETALRQIQLQAETYNPLFDLKTELGLVAPYSYNFFGQQEWWFRSTNGSNSANSGLYVLSNGNKLFAFNGVSLTSTLLQTPVVDFNLAPYSNPTVTNNPAQLFNALPGSPATVYVNRGALYDVKLQFGLTAAPYTKNAFGQQEWWFASTNGSNPQGGKLFFLLPNGQLYAWDGFQFNTSLARGPIASLAGTGAYEDPSKLTQARPQFIEDPLFELKDRYGLTKADFGFNVRGQQEKYFLSTNGSNPQGAGYYLLMPNGDLLAWRGTIASSIFVTNVGVAVYNNPEKIYAASGQVSAIVATSNGATGDVNLNPHVAFTGTVKITTTLNDGAATAKQQFLLNVPNTAPTLQPIANVFGSSAAGSTTVNLVPADADGDQITLLAQVQPYNQLLQDKTRLGISGGAFGFNARGFNEKYFINNLGQFFILATNNRLYTWDGISYQSTVAQTPVANFNDPIYGGVNVYNSPELLSGATAPSAPPVTTSIAGNILTLNWDTNFAGNFLVTVYASDGSSTVVQRILVTITND